MEFAGIGEIMSGKWRWGMKRRIAIWTSAGFLVAWFWILYAFVTPPDFLVMSMRQVAVEAIVIVSCPIAFAGRYFPLHFWWIPPINAATYAVAGLIVEALRRKSTPSPVA